MKTKELKQKSEKEMKKLLSDKQEALRNFRFAVAGSKTRNVKEGLALKKDVARIKTLLNEKK